MALHSHSLLSTLLVLAVISVTQTANHSSAAAQEARARDVDNLVRDAAFRSFGNRSRTATPYRVQLSPKLATAIVADTFRYRTGSLRRHGAVIKEFKFHPGVVVRPHAKRLVVVVENMGNLSSIYQRYENMSGFHLVSPVLGLLVYNAGHFFNSSIHSSEVEIAARKEPIVIDFSSHFAAGRFEHGLLCAAFEMDGNVTVFDMATPTTCKTRREGHFGLVVRNNVRLGVEEGKKEVGKWKVVVAVAAACGFVAVLLGLVAVAFVRTKKRRRVAEMERRAYEEEALRISMVGHVRAPSAGASRTTPVIEERSAYDPSL